MKFKLVSDMKPQGGQPQAIAKLTKGYEKYPMQTLLGITGSGKTFTIANLIQNVQKPTLVLAHNKILAAQLYQEFKELFPENKVEYFISYYDYYQPESYVPTTDTYIEKTATVNEEIERLRLRAISSVLSRDDVIIVASISCIYGAGNPNDFKELSLEIKVGDRISRSEFITKLVNMQYERNDLDLINGKFRVRGDVVDIIPSYDKNIIRVEMFGDEIEKITELDPITNEKITNIDKIRIYPGKQFVTTNDKIEIAISQIKEELNERIKELPLLESERLKKRTKYDLEMIEEMSYCTGIENYSRHFEGRKAGEAPYCLLDYFPKGDFLLVIDESHQTIPQANAMYKGDFSRKTSLVDFGFRLASALDNRPLKFEEFEKYFNHTVFVSATPSDYELQKSGQLVEQIIRPTGLLDPIIEVEPSEGQVAHLISQIKITIANGDRVLVTTLTKRMAEDLTNYLSKQEINVRYMHSDIESLDRIELIRSLRSGEFDVLVGINLLREGLDIPEVSLVAILDADKEGFLRNEKSLIQTIGRAARNENGRVIMYANATTLSMRVAIEKTRYRRNQQIKYNKENGIVPKTINKKVENKQREIKGIKHIGKSDIDKELIRLEAQMKKAANDLDFELAINLRDTLEALKKEQKYNN